MSLFSFFAQQRSHWQQQTTDQPAAYVAGGLAALDQAKAAFRITTLYNAQQQTTATQHELEEVSYQLAQARKKIKHLEISLAAMTQQATEAPRWHQRRAYSARKSLRKVAAAANHLTMRPENKLRKILEVINNFLATSKEEIDEFEQADTALLDDSIPAGKGN